MVDSLLVHSIAETGKNNAPVPAGTEGETIRGTTSGSPFPHENGLVKCVCTLPRGNGRSRSTPTGQKSRWGASSKVYSPSVALPFPPSRGSLGSAMTGTGPLLRCIRRVFYPIL